MEVGGELPAIVDLLQFHAVIISNSVWCDCSCSAVNQQQSRLMTIQTGKFLTDGAATVQIHIVGAANSFQV